MLRLLPLLLLLLLLLLLRGHGGGRVGGGGGRGGGRREAGQVVAQAQPARRKLPGHRGGRAVAWLGGG